MVRKYLALTRSAWALSLEYRAEQVVFMLTNFLSIIMMTVWLSISRNGPIGGFTSGDFVAYYMVGLIVRQFTSVWSSLEMSYEIREGTMSVLLLRPIHPIHRDITANWAEHAMRLVILGPLVLLVLIFTPDVHLYLTPVSIGAFVISLLGAWGISFLFDYAIGILAFWSSQATAFSQAVGGLKVVFSGVLAPLQMFPAFIQGALNWLPFRYQLALCSEILLGQTRDERLLFGLAVQWAWVLFFFILVRILWKLGVRSYGAVGA